MVDAEQTDCVITAVFEIVGTRELRHVEKIDVWYTVRALRELFLNNDSMPLFYLPEEGSPSRNPPSGTNLGQ
jgi:hypothetical protein